jgi:hypothetical protein
VSTLTPTLAAVLAAVAVLALLMVGAMVQFSRAAIWWRREGGAGEPVGPRPLSPLGRWGLVYGLTWLALVGAFLVLFTVTGEGFSARNLALLGAVVAGYLGVNALLIVFARVLVRANRRPAAAATAWDLDEGPGALAKRAEEREEPALGDSAPAGFEEAPEVISASEPVPHASPWARARRALATVAFLAGVLLVIGVAEAVPPLVRLGAWTDAHRGPLLLAAGILAGAGFVLFMGAVLHMVLTAGRPMSRAEVAALKARTRLLDLGPAIARGAAGRVAGDAAGASGEETFTLAEVKAAHRARAWRVSPTWRRRFTLLVGAALLTLGLMGVALALSPVGLKLVIAGFLLYGIVRTVAGLARV